MTHFPNDRLHQVARTIAVVAGALIVVLFMLYVALLALQPLPRSDNAAQSGEVADELAILASLSVDGVPSLEEREEILSTLSGSRGQVLSIEQKLELLESLQAGL
jgi:hypothetical protein